MKYEDIVGLADRVVESIEKKHTATLDNTRNYATNAYICSKSILKPGKAVGVKKIPLNPKPQHSVVNGGIGIKNFTTLCQLYVNGCDKKGYAPSYLKFNNHKIGIDTWAYATARVVTYYDEKKRLPNKVIVTSKIFDDEIKRIEEEKRRKEEAERKAREEAERKRREEEARKALRKYGHSQESGCDNRGQNTSYYCGPHSLQECIRNLTGEVISQDTLAEWAGTTADGGTDHDGLNTAIAMAGRRLGVSFNVQWYNFREIGWDGLRDAIQSNNKDFLIHNLYRYNPYEGIDGDGHYETVNRIYDDYCDVQNSLGDRCDYGCYCGYVDERYLSTFEMYMSGISQKSVMVITNESY